MVDRVTITGALTDSSASRAVVNATAAYRASLLTAINIATAMARTAIERDGARIVTDPALHLAVLASFAETQDNLRRAGLPAIADVCF